MRVLKFGGTSLADRRRIEVVARLVREADKEGRVVVVASAVAGITNRLAALISATSSIDTDWAGEVDAIERQHLEILTGLPPTTSDPAAYSTRAVIEALRADLGTLAVDPTVRDEIAARSRTPSRVVAVSAIEEVTVLRLRAGFQVEVGEVLMSCRASSDGATLVAVPTHRAEAVIGRLQEHEGILLEPHFPASIVTLVGHDIALHPWVAGRALEALARRGIVVRSFAAGASPHTVALLVDRSDLKNALCTIHDALMLDRERVADSCKRPEVGRKEIRQVPAA